MENAENLSGFSFTLCIFAGWFGVILVIERGGASFRLRCSGCFMNELGASQVICLSVQSSRASI